jgi:hypothetical protein
MGKAKKLKMLRKAVHSLAPDLPFAAVKPHYKKMKRELFGKGGKLHGK